VGAADSRTSWARPSLVGWMLGAIGLVVGGLWWGSSGGPERGADTGPGSAPGAHVPDDNQPAIPEIDVTEHDPGSLARLILATPEATRWDVTFGIGEQVGRQVGDDLAAVARIGAVLPAGLGTVFYNGVGHAVEWNVDDVAAEEARIAAHIPLAHRASAYMGIIIRYATLYSDSPDDVVAFAEDFGARHKVDAIDGVRIGVQRSAETDPAGTLALVAAYPDRYRNGLAEEIGWRIGSDLGIDPEVVLPLSERLEKALRVRFAHGVCRAGWTPGHSLRSMRPLLHALPGLEREDCIHAIAFSMSEAGPAGASREVLSSLDDPDIASRIETAVSVYQGRCLGHLNPDLTGGTLGMPCPAMVPVAATLDPSEAVGLRDEDGDGFRVPGDDCDDSSPSVNPGAKEILDGIDNNCDGRVDEGTPGFDKDGDGYSPMRGDCDDDNPNKGPYTAEVVDGVDNDCDGVIDEDTLIYDDDRDGWSEAEGDCDDGDDQIHPGKEEVWDSVDQDCDGYVDEGTGNFDDDGDGFSESEGDCDDAVATVYPSAPEIPDGRDNDCNSLIDDGPGAIDEDGDGHSTLFGDCDDADPSAHPGAIEIPDGIDNDCDGQVDQGTVVFDDDGDGWTENEGDCDDADGSVYPDAEEKCDERDNDCDGEIDEDFFTTWYADVDGDGAGDRDSMRISCVQPSGHVSNADDCDDSAAEVVPDAVDTCNGVDDNCDGVVDDSPDRMWYADRDQDGYGRTDGTALSCDAPVDADGGRYSAAFGDCDDADPNVHPDAKEVPDGVDNDCDDRVDQGTVAFDDDGDGWTENEGDCDDEDAEISPDAEEQCDETDNDCDGEVDEDFFTSWYADADGDGAGDRAAKRISCLQPSGHVDNADDCDDGSSEIVPGAVDTCNGVDDNCDGVVDESPDRLWYADRDQDGYGLAAETTMACEQPAGFVADSTDCGDDDPSRFPGADEACDGLDNDCDGEIDEDPVAHTLTVFTDADGDGVGVAEEASVVCEMIEGQALRAGDCDDADPAVYPDAPELCDGLDNNCDGIVDDGLETQSWYVDNDGDGFGGPVLPLVACAAPSGYLATATDCDDSDPAIYPGADEACDLADNDCDELVDENVTTSFFEDRDGDGYGDPNTVQDACSVPNGYVDDDQDCDDDNPSIHPWTLDSCNGIDENCDGAVGGWWCPTAEAGG
jgi:hypothetical protein